MEDFIFKELKSSTFVIFSKAIAKTIQSGLHEKYRKQIKCLEKIMNDKINAKPEIKNKTCSKILIMTFWQVFEMYISY